MISEEPKLSVRHHKSNKMRHNESVQEKSSQTKNAKSFDRVDKMAFWKSLCTIFYPLRWLELPTDDRVGNFMQPFTVLIGVRQGCMLCPFLFLIALNGRWEKINKSM